MTILYSNGCSFTANYELKREQRYPSLIGKHFNWQVVDRAIPGSCNSKIIRCALRDCISLLRHDEPIVALIQITFLHRFEYSGDPAGVNCWKYGNSGDLFESIKPADESNWPTEIKDYAKLHFLLQKTDAMFSQLFCQIIGMTSFFKQHNIKYLIYAGPECNEQFPKNDLFYKQLSKDTNILNLETFNMLDLTGNQKHPDATGMKTIADYLINRLAEQV